jgi:hypothetical protein
MLKIEKDNQDFFVEKMLFRNQFVLGPRYVEDFPEWQKIEITKNVFLTVHPALSVCRAGQGEKTVTLLGSVFDSENPEAGDTEILNGLLSRLTSFENVIACTNGCGGRWVLIVNDGEKLGLFTDAAGLRQVFFTDKEQTGELWCASQPGMIARLLSLRMSAGAVEFIDSFNVRSHKEFRWPGGGSPYNEVCHLLPNHFLDLKTGRCRRYWPEKPLAEISFEEGIDRVSGILPSLIKSAANRFDLAISVTAGIDSRLVLAASRGLENRVSYMTVRQIDKPEDHVDVTVPSVLLPQLGLKHDVVRSSFLIADNYLTVFKKNVALPHYIYVSDAFAIFKAYAQKKAVMTGGVSEIGRWSFRGQIPRERRKNVSPADLAKLQKVKGNPYAIGCFSKWLDGLGDIYNVDVLDLFEWEQGHGVWLANCYLEFDLAWRDIFTPYNCRDLLVTMLSVAEKYRKPPENRFHMELIARLWPETLGVPINPGETKKRRLIPVVASYVPGFLKRGIKNAIGAGRGGLNA